MISVHNEIWDSRGDVFWDMIAYRMVDITSILEEPSASMFRAQE
jgi:hypothetical protein